MVTDRQSPQLAGIDMKRIKADRILIVRPSALGDVCRSVHLLVSLRQAYPKAGIDWLVQDTFADAVRWHPALDGVVPFPRSRLRSWASPQGLADSLQWLWTLREPGYDLVIDAQGLMRSGLFTRATGAAVRVGYANAEEAAWVMYTRSVSAEMSAHSVTRMATLLGAINVSPVIDLRLYTQPGTCERVTARLGLQPQDAYVVCSPTSRWSGKRWPINRFAETTSRLLEARPELRVVIVGAASERPQCGPVLELTARGRVIDAVGQTTVAELMGLIERSSLVLANDSAAVHMAVGLQRPIVALYGPTDVRKVGPWAAEKDVIQHVEPGEFLDHKDQVRGEAIMSRISVDEVLAAVIEKL